MLLCYSKLFNVCIALWIVQETIHSLSVHCLRTRRNCGHMETKAAIPSSFQTDKAMKDAPGLSSAPSMTINIDTPEHGNSESVDYQQRGQWLRAAVLGANDGLVTTASLMMGVGAVKTDSKTMVMSGLAALIAGACSMAIGEFVSVQTQRDVEISNLKRQKKLQWQAIHNASDGLENSTRSPDPSEVLRRPTCPIVISQAEKQNLPSPLQAVFASSLAFSVGALLPLMSAAFIKKYFTRVCVLCGVSSFSLILFGAMGAYLGGSSVVKGSIRVFVGGWIAMMTTYGLLRFFHATTGV